MNRRDFLRSSSLAIAGLTLRPKWAAPPVESSAGRLVLPINRNWRFSPQRVEGATERNFDDAHFELVAIPHEQETALHSFDEKSYEFVSTYRRRFRLTANARGHHVFVISPEP